MTGVEKMSPIWFLVGFISTIMAVVTTEEILNNTRKARG